MTRIPAALLVLLFLYSLSLAGSARAEEKPPEGDPPPSPAKEKASKKKGGAGKKSSAEAEAEYDKIRAEFESQRELQPYERAATVVKFGDAPCKKSVEFLTKLYAEEKNVAFIIATSMALAKIGTLESVTLLVNTGFPLLLEHAEGPDELIPIMSHRFEDKVEEWLLRNGLTPDVRKNPAALNSMLQAFSRFKHPGKVTVLATEARSASPELQARILENLRRNASDKKVEQLALGLARTDNPEVRVAAFDVLDASGSAKHRSLFSAGLKDPHWEMRVLCLDALARLKDKDALKQAKSLLEDKDQRVQIASVDILLRTGGKEVMDPLIGALDTAKGRVRDDIADALARLTGKNLGPVKAQWESWWAVHKDKDMKLVAMSPEDFAILKETEQAEASTVTATPFFLGLRVLGNPAFLIDTSESMQDEYVPKAELAKKAEEKKEKEGRTVVAKKKEPEKEGGGGEPDAKMTRKKKRKLGIFSRMDLAKREMTKVLKTMKDKESSFDIIRFNTDIADLAASLGTETKSLILMDPKAREDAEAFVKSLKPEGLTNISAALRAAFQYPDLDTIFLLSDGAPTVGIVDPAELLSEVERINRRRKVKIHVISFNPQPMERKLLSSLAHKNQGTYLEK
jgi:HEAT repeat protein